MRSSLHCQKFITKALAQDHHQPKQLLLSILAGPRKDMHFARPPVLKVLFTTTTYGQEFDVSTIANEDSGGPVEETPLYMDPPAATGPYYLSHAQLQALRRETAPGPWS